jgi:hypothetical protein
VKQFTTLEDTVQLQVCVVAHAQLVTAACLTLSAAHALRVGSSGSVETVLQTTARMPADSRQATQARMAVVVGSGIGWHWQTKSEVYVVE